MTESTNVSTEPSEAPESPTLAATDINIMLVSHTNAGKTTLVRTLLGKDVGEVLDAPDVTRAVSAYDLIADPDAGALRLWDTPGFGDSFRLAKRLRQKHRWIAWIVREVWDRYRNPRLWRSQHLALDLRQRADVILYLVNALERPVDAIYVVPELEALGWIGKPVLAILNQSGVPVPGEAEKPGIVEWRQALAGYPVVSATLRLDSYTRCWAQELVLLHEVGQILPEQHQHGYQILARRLQDSHRERFDVSITTMADYLMRLAGDKLVLDNGALSVLKDIWGLIRSKISWGKADELQAPELAMKALAQRYMIETTTLTDELIALHRLTGASAGQVIKAASDKFVLEGPVDEKGSALAGGVISGALAGLGADLMAGGLTLGTGALVGGVLGAVGAAAAAKGYNVYTNKGEKIIAWSPASLTQAFVQTVMLYLAIAHFGRGQGEWHLRENPEHLHTLVGEIIEPYRERIDGLWGHAATGATAPAVRDDCTRLLRDVLMEVLHRLYPEARAWLI